MDQVSDKGIAAPGHGWPRFLCAGILFILIFWYPWETPGHLKTWESRHGETYILMPDSPSFIGFRGWTNPWHAIRSIGYPAFLYPFLYPDQQNFMRGLGSTGRDGFQNWFDPEQPIYSMPRKIGISGKFAAVALAQRLILAGAITFFYFSLCRWFNQIFAFAALLVSIYVAPPPPPQAIMMEPLSCALTWFCAAFLLLAGKSTRQTAFFAFACLCAALAFLVRPQTLSLTGLCSLIFVYKLLISGRKHFIASFPKQAVAFCPLLISYAYIAWLSITGGQLFLHTLPEIYYSSFCYFADAEDAQYMPTERSKKFTAWFGEHKEEFFKKMREGRDGYGKMGPLENFSHPKRRHLIGGSFLGRGPMRDTWSHFANEEGLGNLDRKGKSILGKELMAGLKQRHQPEMLIITAENFIGALGWFSRDVYALALFPKATFTINIVALVLSLCTALVSTKVRWPLLVMDGIHLMAILAASLGYLVLQRYVEPTQAFLLLAGLCSLWFLGERCYAQIARRQRVVPGRYRF